MRTDIAILGSGGQGVLTIGRFLAEGAITEGWEVVWLPSYGAEKRGGTVSCNVAISNEKIGALFVVRPDAAVAMNPVAVSKLGSAVKPGGILLVNESTMPVDINRNDIKLICVPVKEMAAELGDSLIGNSIVLGALIAAFPVVSVPGIMKLMDSMLAKNPKYLQLNKLAFDKGYSWGQKKQTG
jgi:2-oxoglutarate ferredoxin oxidoreductase subunit gamma